MRQITALLNISELKMLDTNTYDLVDIDELANNIEAVGLITALTVTPAEDGKYDIVSGNRRFTAIKKLQEENRLPAMLTIGIPCYIKEYETEIDMSLDVELANLEVRDLGNSKVVHEFNVVRLIKEKIDNKHERAQWLTDKFRKSPRYVRALQSILDSGNEELITTSTEQGNIMLAAQVSKMDEESQSEYIDKIKDGATAKEAFNEVKKKNTDNVFSDITEDDDWDKILDEVDVDEEYFDDYFATDSVDNSSSDIEKESFEQKILNWIEIRMELWEDESDIDDEDRDVIEKMKELINKFENL